MKTPIRITSALLAATMLFVSSCSGGNAQTTTKASETTIAAETTSKADETTAAPETTGAGVTEKEERRFATPIPANMKMLGRTLWQDDVLWLSQSASGVEFEFEGTELTVDIKGDGAAVGSDPTSKARFAVYVNGERRLDEMVESAEKTYEIIKSEKSEKDVIKLVKLSESANSAFGIEKFDFVGDHIIPTSEKELKIEFIGDSITCGYGVDDEVKEHHFSTQTEDATKTYAYKAAEILDADYSMVCYSGHGIISGYTDNGEKNELSLIPPIYEQFSKSYGSSKGHFDETTPWDFEQFKPDYIVINLGTNDASYVKTKEARQEFIEQSTEFIRQVRKCNPDAYIFWALGIMGTNLNSSVKKAVEAYVDETGDNKVSFIALPQQNGDKNGYGADWHPTEATHAEAAEKLVGKMKEILEGSQDEQSDAA